MSGYFDIFCAIIATGFVALKGAWCLFPTVCMGNPLISLLKSDILWRFSAFANIAVR